MRAVQLIFLLTGLIAACDQAPVEWNDPTAVPRPADAPLLSLDADGQTRFVENTAPAMGPVDPARCAASLRMTQGATRLFAAWWSAKGDSNAVLDAALSTDSGRTWGKSLPVDVSDVSVSGCGRPAPSIATVGDDLYVAYSVKAAEGTGVFFAHLMGPMLHSPVPVVYGDRVVPTAIAAEGMHVAVAYEEPNGTRRQIGVALSRTQGHIFEDHLVASRSVDAATVPSVALMGSRIAVGWTTSRQDTAVQIVRTGRIR